MAKKARRRSESAIEADIDQLTKEFARKLLKLHIEDEFPDLVLKRVEIDFISEYSMDSIRETATAVMGAHICAIERGLNVVDESDSNGDGDGFNGGPNEDDRDDLDDDRDSSDRSDESDNNDGYDDDQLEENHQIKAKGSGWAEVVSLPRRAQG